MEASTVDNQKDIYKRNSEKEIQVDGETKRWKELGNAEGGSIIVPLTSCLTGLDILFCKKMVSCPTADSKPVKQEVNGTVLLPPLVFPERTLEGLRARKTDVRRETVRWINM